VYAICQIPSIVSRRQKNGSVIIALFFIARVLNSTSCDDWNIACANMVLSRNSRISEALRNGVSSLSSIVLSGNADGPLLNTSVCLCSAALTLPAVELTLKWQDAGVRLQQNCHVTTRWNFLQNRHCPSTRRLAIIQYLDI